MLPKEILVPTDLSEGAEVALDYAWCIKDGMTTDTHGAVGGGGGRLHFDMAYQF